MLLKADGGGGVSNLSGQKRYEGVRFNVISVTRGWVGVQFPSKKGYITLEWPLTHLDPNYSLTMHKSNHNNFPREAER